jgi:PAS domain S-box-containing protein
LKGFEMGTKTSQIVSNILKTPLLRNLLITSLLISLIFPLYGVFAIIPSFSSQFIKITEEEAERTASYLKDLIIKDKAELIKDSFSKEIIREIEIIKQAFVLEKLKIFSKQGEIIFSTAPKDIGKKNKHDYFYNIVAKGNVYTKIVNKNTRTLEGRMVTADVGEIYVPVLSSGSFIGAFEIYYDITHRKNELDNLLVHIRLILFGIASVLMLIVLLILFKASENILERKQAERSLQKAHDNLENMIKERTSDLKQSNKKLLNEINERRQIGDSLIESEERFRSISDSAQDAIIMMNHIGEITYWNKSAENIFQYKSHEVLNKDLHALLVPQKYHHSFNKGFGKFLTTGEGYAIGKILELWAKRKDGQKFPVELSLSSVKIKGLWNAIGIIRDISTRKKDEKDKKKLESQLVQAQKMQAMGILAGGIAHDFNNILFPVLGNTEMLIMDVPEDSPFKERLKEIYTAAQRAKDLVKQILTFSRQENHELFLMKMQPIIKEALKLIRSTIPSTIEIKQDISADCGVIKADPTQIHQIVMNLTTNAFHAMEESGGELKVKLEQINLDQVDIITQDVKPGVYICLTVADTGTGMDKDLIKKIFDPFFTTKEKGKSAGMGLSVVHGIVKGLGGIVQVFSEPGIGSEFKVYLPREKNASKKQTLQPKEPIQGGTEQILIVDDEEPIITMEKEMLELLGYKITAFTSSLEAFEAFRANPDKFDLIITDMTMPFMPGDKLASELMKIRPDIPILLCTGFSKTMSKEKAASLGIKDFLIKPIVMKDLTKKVRQVLDGNLSPT